MSAALIDAAVEYEAASIALAIARERLNTARGAAKDAENSHVIAYQAFDEAQAALLAVAAYPTVLP